MKVFHEGCSKVCMAVPALFGVELRMAKQRHQELENVFGYPIESVIKRLFEMKKQAGNDRGVHFWAHGSAGTRLSTQKSQNPDAMRWQYRRELESVGTAAMLRQGDGHLIYGAKGGKE